MPIDETHDVALKSFVPGADAPGGDFPIQNLPYCAFRPRGSGDAPRIGVVIGDAVLEVAAVGPLMEGAAGAAGACAAPHLNALMELGPDAWAMLRLALSRLLRTGADRT